MTPITEQMADHKPPPQDQPPQHAEDEDTADTAWDWPAKTVVPAGQAAGPVATRAAPSVFALGAGIAMPTMREMARMLKAHGRTGHAAAFKAPPATVERTADGVRCVGAQYPANRWTEQREQQEKQRRARQKPPKPTKKARRRGRKLLEVIGDDIWDE